MRPVCRVQAHKWVAPVGPVSPGPPPIGRANPIMGDMADTLSPDTTELPLKPGIWTLDQAHFRVGFAIRHLGVATVRGHFSGVKSELAVGDSLEDTRLTATVDLTTIDTGNPDRNTHMQASEWLDTARRRPTMTFASTAITADGFAYEVDGELTIGEVTQPVRLSVQYGGTADFFDGTRHAGFHATTAIRRRDFGLHFGPFNRFVGDKVEIEIDLEMIEP